MQVIEMTKKKALFGKSYALAINTAPTSEDEFIDEWRDIGSALVQWKKQRKNKADVVMLTVVSAKENHAPFKSLIQHVYENETTISPILKSAQVIVALLNTQGQPEEEYELGVA